MSPPHGSIVGGVVATPDLAASLGDYRDRLGLALVAEGLLGAGLAAAWGCPGLASAPTATLQPVSGEPCFVRLVEQPLPAGFRPTTSFGWNAYEITVQDVFGWPARLTGSGFDIVGPPKRIPGMDAFVAMQMVGRGGEVIYLNQVAADMATVDLPRARSPVDRIFIVIHGVADRAAAVGWYRDRLGLDAGDTHSLNYTMINRAFGLADGTQSTLTMVQNARLPIVEVDGYPAAATARAVPPGGLPPGNALVSLSVDSLDGLDLDWLGPPARHPGPVYDGGRAATARGPNGALLELVEAR